MYDCSRAIGRFDHVLSQNFRHLFILKRIKRVHYAVKNCRGVKKFAIAAWNIHVLDICDRFSNYRYILFCQNIRRCKPILLYSFRKLQRIRLRREVHVSRKAAARCANKKTILLEKVYFVLDLHRRYPEFLCDLLYVLG